MYVCMYVCIYVCMYACMYVYVCAAKAKGESERNHIVHWQQSCAGTRIRALMMPMAVKCRGGAAASRVSGPKTRTQGEFLFFSIMSEEASK